MHARDLCLPTADDDAIGPVGPAAVNDRHVGRRSPDIDDQALGCIDEHLGSHHGSCRARQDGLDRPNAGEVFRHQRTVASHDRDADVEPALGERRVDCFEKVLDDGNEPRVEQRRCAAPDHVGLDGHARRLDDDLAKAFAQELGAALLDDRTVVQRVEARNAKRLGLLEEGRVAFVERLPIGDGHVAAVVGAHELGGEHVFVRYAEHVLRVDTVQDLVRRADDDEPRPAAFALDAGVRGQRRRQRHMLDAREDVRVEAVHRVHDADHQVFLGGQRLRLREHLDLIRVDDNRVGVRTARVDSQPNHLRSIRIS